MDLRRGLTGHHSFLLEQEEEMIDNMRLSKLSGLDSLLSDSQSSPAPQV